MPSCNTWYSLVLYLADHVPNGIRLGSFSGVKIGRFRILQIRQCGLTVDIIIIHLFYWGTISLLNNEENYI